MKHIFIAIAIVTIFAGSAFAHPPSDITELISGTKVNVMVKHTVSDPKKHFINHILITVNGKNTSEKKFIDQTDNEKQAAPFDIPTLKKGDKVSVEATCSRSGERKKEFTVE